MSRSFKQRLEESLFRLQAVQEEHEAEAQAEEEEEEAHTSSAHAGGGLKRQSKFHNFFGKGDQVANLDHAAKIARAPSGGSGGGGDDDDNDDDAEDQLWSRFGLSNTASRSSTFPSDHSRSPAVQGSALTTTTDGVRDEIFARWPLNFTLDVSDLTEQCDGDLNVISDVLAESVTQGAKSIDSLEEAAISGDTEQLSYHAIFIGSLASSVGARKLECSASSLTILVDGLSSADKDTQRVAAEELTPALNLLQADFQDFSLNVVDPEYRNQTEPSLPAPWKGSRQGRGSFSDYILELCENSLSTPRRELASSPNIDSDKLETLLEQVGEGGASATFDSSASTLRHWDASEVVVKIKAKSQSFDTAGLVMPSKPYTQGRAQSSPAKARANKALSQESSPVLNFSDDDSSRVEPMPAGENVAAATATGGAAKREMCQDQFVQEEVHMDTVFEVADTCLTRMNLSWGNREEVQDIVGVIVDTCKSANLHRVVKRCKILEEWCKIKEGRGSGKPMIDAVEQQLETSKAMYRSFAVCV